MEGKKKFMEGDRERPVRKKAPAQEAFINQFNETARVRRKKGTLMSFKGKKGGGFHRNFHHS